MVSEKKFMIVCYGCQESFKSGQIIHTTDKPVVFMVKLKHVIQP